MIPDIKPGAACHYCGRGTMQPDDVRRLLVCDRCGWQSFRWTRPDPRGQPDETETII